MEWMLDEETLEQDAEPETSDESPIDDEETLEVLKAVHADAITAGQLRRAKVLSMLVARYTPERSEDEDEVDDEEEEEEEEDSEDEDDEDDEDDGDEDARTRTFEMKQYQWDALIDWLDSLVKQDEMVAFGDFSTKSRTYLRKIYNEIKGEWAAPNPGEDAEFSIHFGSSEGWDAVEKIFQELGRGLHIAPNVSTKLRQTIVQAGSIMYAAI